MMFSPFVQVLDKVMRSLESDKRCRQNFIKVELNGLVHTDDRVALLAIAKQLDVENEMGEKIAVSVCVCVCVCVCVGVMWDKERRKRKGYQL